MLKSVSELVRYRELVRHLVGSELKVRYRNSSLGVLWTVLNPLLLTLVLWAVFSRIGRINEKNYALFLLSGVMSWIFFQQTIDHGLTAIIKNKAVIQKIYVPKLVFPVTVAASNFVNLGFFLAAYLIVAAFTPVGFPFTAPLVVPAAVMLLFLAMGFSLVFCTLNVFFRDFTHLTSILLRALFYLTPIIYPPEWLGPKAAAILQLNPVYYPVVAIRDVLYYGRMPPLSLWLVGFAVASTVLMIGLFSFTRAEHKFVYYA